MTTNLVGGIPATIDWRLLGAVTSVKDQDDCDVPDAFSAAGAIEALYFS